MFLISVVFGCCYVMLCRGCCDCILLGDCANQLEGMLNGCTSDVPILVLQFVKIVARKGLFDIYLLVFNICAID
jgi:hypothetical protein